MTPDISRNGFDHPEHYTRVIMQQGRVQLDSDWNEQADIILRMIRQMFMAIVGTSAGPPDREAVAKQDATPTKPEIPAIPAFSPFKIGYEYKNDPKRISDLKIGAGYFYVNGIRCENPNDASYLDQPYLDVPTDSDPFPSNYPYLVYLDVWEEPVTVLDDPSLKEPALGGLDTTARSRVRWAVQLKEHKGAVPAGGNPPPSGAGAAPNGRVFFPKADLPDPQSPHATSDDDLLAFEVVPGPVLPLLRARLVPPDESAAKKPCAIAPDARFRGTENQLYRVEIHSAGSKPTFKWSRDNATVAVRITNVASDDNRDGPWQVTLEDLGRDSLHTLAIGDWVEIVDTGPSVKPVLNDTAADLLRVSEIDRETRVVTLERPIKNPDQPIGVPASIAYGADNIQHQRPILRRWNQTGNVVSETEVKDIPVGTIEIDQVRPVDSGKFDDSDKAEASWYELEDGLWVQFQGPDADHYSPTFRVGDYWLIPARTADNGSILWDHEKDEKGNQVKDHGDHGNPTYGPRPGDGVKHYYAPLAVVVDPADDTDYPFLTNHPDKSVFDRRWKIAPARVAPPAPS